MDGDFRFGQVFVPDRTIADLARANRISRHLRQLTDAAPVRRVCASLKALLGARVALLRDKVDISAMARDIAQTPALAQAGNPGTVMIGKLPPAAGGATLRHGALRHLMDNAWKFAAGAPGAVVEAGSLGTAQDAAADHVRDKGIRFRENRVSTLFQPCKRLLPADKFPGMGLAMVKYIVGPMADASGRRARRARA